MSEADDRRVTYGHTLAAAETLAKRNPAMTFVCVSGKGTDRSVLGRVMWACVKGATENALLRLPFKAAGLHTAAEQHPQQHETDEGPLRHCGPALPWYGSGSFHAP